MTHNSFQKLNVLRMIGFDTLNLSQRGICDLVFTTLGQAWVAFIANLKDCCCGLIYLVKARWFYILTTLVFVISASSVNCSSLSVISYLILKAPWFHFIILLGLGFQLLKTFTVAENKESRFRLSIKLRMALGRLRAKRLSYVELLSLSNSPACLHSLEFSCGIAQERSLSLHIFNASLEDLLYMCRASALMALYLGKLLANRTKETKKERRRKRNLRDCTTDNMRGKVIYSFLLILLILSLFEKYEENHRNVILYGVPGLRSMSISKEETYSTIRKKILKFSPNFSNFYFVHRGLIIKDEDVVIVSGNGHVVLNVHSRGDLKGGTRKDKKSKRGRERCLADDD